MLQLDAEALYAELREGVRTLWREDAALVGIWSGGAWLAERLQADLGLTGRHGVISSTLHRDDFGSRGLAGAAPTELPFAIEGRHIVLIDDVLYTGRTIRAVVNELYDFGRPASVQLAVLVVVGIARLVVSFLLRAVGLGLIDRMLGAIFGIARGVLVVLLCVMLGGLTPLPKESWWRNAVFAPPLETAVLAMKPWMPEAMAKKIRYR